MAKEINQSYDTQGLLELANDLEISIHFYVTTDTDHHSMNQDLVLWADLGDKLYRFAAQISPIGGVSVVTSNSVSWNRVLEGEKAPATLVVSRRMYGILERLFSLRQNVGICVNTTGASLVTPTRIMS